MKRSAPRTGPSSYKKAKLALTPPTYSRRGALNRVEVKTVYGQDTYAAIATAGNTHVFGRTNQGVNDDERVGKAIRHTGFELRAQFARNASPTASARIIVGIWKQAKGGLAPGSAEVLQLADYMSSIRASESANLVILSDDNIVLNASAVDSTDAPLIGEYHWKKSYKKTFIQEYDGASSTDVQNWTHFYLLIAQGAASMSAIVNYNCRYTD